MGKRMPAGSLIIAAGGTGGHLFPARAFADEMRARGWSTGLISDSRGLRYAADFPADWKEEVEAASPDLRRPLALPGALLRIRSGIGAASRLMRRQPVALVAGFGGYPAFPALAAARRLGLPMLIHEQNAVLGRVNRQFARAAGLVASGFQRLERLPSGARHVVVGNPVRAPVLEAGRLPYPSLDGLLNIFVTGGSQGSRIIGEVVPEAIAAHVPSELRRRLRIVQQVRPEQIEAVSEIYRRAGIECELADFFTDMPRRLAQAHLVIARSGAGTISELAAVGRPSILIPLATAMDDHQRANALALTGVGAADMVLESDLDPGRLGALVSARLADPADLASRALAARSAARPDAARMLADLAEKIAGL